MKQAETVLITGATGGIGREFCQIFARYGYHLVITGTNPEKLNQLADRLRRNGTRVHVIQADLALPETPQKIYHELKEHHITVDVLVNNAGFGQGSLFADACQQVQDAMISVNMRAPTSLCRLFLPDMIARGRGYILNVSSMGAYAPGPNNAVYCASKAYLLQLSLALTKETVGTGVSVTAICPGAVHTGFAGRAHMQNTMLFHRGVLSPDLVAQAGFRAMVQKRPMVSIGTPAKLASFGWRMVPRMAAASISGFIQKRS